MKFLSLPHVALALAAFCVPACGKAEEKAIPVVTSGPSSVWLVEKDGHHIHLAGTIHLLREEAQAWSRQGPLRLHLPE